MRARLFIGLAGDDLEVEDDRPGGGLTCEPPLLPLVASLINAEPPVYPLFSAEPALSSNDWVVRAHRSTRISRGSCTRAPKHRPHPTSIIPPGTMGATLQDLAGGCATFDKQNGPQIILPGSISHLGLTTQRQLGTSPILMTPALTLAATP
jgi:hypothetical protein